MLPPSDRVARATILLFPAIGDAELFRRLAREWLRCRAATTSTSAGWVAAIRAYEGAAGGADRAAILLEDGLASSTAGDLSSDLVAEGERHA